MFQVWHKPFFAEEVKVDNNINGDYTFVSEGQIDAIEDTFYFDENCFRRSSYLGGCHLGSLSIQAAGASVSAAKGSLDPSDTNNGKYIISFLEALGFENVELNKYYTAADKENAAGVAVGMMKISQHGKDYNLLAIVPRSAGYGREWSGNANVGDSNIWKKQSGINSDFVFVRNINDNETYSRFLGIKADGEAVSTDKYIASEGSVIISLKADYLESLKTGEHSLTALFNDGECTVRLFVTAQEKNKDNSAKTAGYVAPKTGIE